MLCDHIDIANGLYDWGSRLLDCRSFCWKSGLLCCFHFVVAETELAKIMLNNPMKFSLINVEARHRERPSNRPHCQARLRGTAQQE